MSAQIVEQAASAVRAASPPLPFAVFAVARGFVRAGGPVRFWQPSPADGCEAAEEVAYNPALPSLFFLPGIDGSGEAARRQFVTLAAHFNLWCLLVPLEDRTSFAGLVDYVVGFVTERTAAQDALGPPRPVYVVGTSFGGMLGIAVVARCKRINRLVLINPATSFARTVWPKARPLLIQAPEHVINLTNLMANALSENPLSVALAEAQETTNPMHRLLRFTHRLVSGDSGTQGGLSRRLPPPGTVRHKLALLVDGSLVVDDTLLQRVESRTLLFGSDLDLLLPSADEVQRLARLLPLARAIVLRGRSHTILREAGVDLFAMLNSEGFYTRDLVLSGPPGAPLTVELPTPREAELAAGIGLAAMRAAASPVFLSVDAAGGVHRGLGAVDWDRRPILLVGNHQTLAPDLALLLDGLLRERRVLARGLAHPLATGYRPPPREAGAAPEPRVFNGIVRNFGAVTVTGRNLYDLMAHGEVALLFPGGIRESNKHKGEAYQLFWPEGPEFVRTAARFGATIVPLSAVGVDDGLEVVLDGPELLRLPLLGDFLRWQLAGLPKVGLRGEESALPPLALPRVTEGRRLYFLFGQPIHTSPDMDRAKAAEVYQEVQEAVAGGIEWLLRKREEDPYQFIGPRALQEIGAGQQAPTFQLVGGEKLSWTRRTSSPTPAAPIPHPTPLTDQAEESPFPTELGPNPPPEVPSYAPM
eukprot:EG_transcript_3970